MNKHLTYRFFKFFLFSIVFLFAISSCETGATETEPPEYVIEKIVEDTILPTTLKEKKPEVILTYRIDSLVTEILVDSFRTRFSEEEKNIIFALNRVDGWRLSPGDKLIVPDSLTGDLMDYSPFPKNLEILDSIPKTVVISQRIQGIALYEYSKLVHWGPVSTGKSSTPTPNGMFYGNYKAREKISTINPDWLMPYYFNYMNFEGVGVHEYSMPGYPASHACVRLRKEEAIYVYDWAQQWKLDKRGEVVERNGTPFMVIGKYDYEKPSPWLTMAEDPKGNFLTASEMDTLRSYRAKYFKDERNFQKLEVLQEDLNLLEKTQIEAIR